MSFEKGNKNANLALSTNIHSRLFEGPGDPRSAMQLPFATCAHRYSNARGAGSTAEKNGGGGPEPTFADLLKIGGDNNIAGADDDQPPAFVNGGVAGGGSIDSQVFAFCFQLG